MNEAQTRFNKIDPKLRDAGWGIVPGSVEFRFCDLQMNIRHARDLRQMSYAQDLPTA